ncbi:DMT family transporter [Curvibacter sp. APW13]|uniref:DMT family transporter n=1 Tax=Curvibacter sp. APW13 TaxID=3077236 RepID=UPI0028DDB002|nr:DMT family transporter [Curvibacter sp. APW13]MDT8990682.1 DMT family transporter [Curvibacter sp. APW13]
MTFSPWARLVPLLAVLGSVTALGLGTSFAKQLFPVIGAQGTTALRVGFSALLMVLFFRPWRYRIAREDLGFILRYGVALGLMNLLFYMSIRTIPFGLAVAIEFSGPLAVAMWGSRRPVDFVWLLLAVTGLGLLLPWQAGADALDPVGVGYALAAALSWALYIVFGKRVGHLPTGLSVSLGLSCAALVVFPVGLVHAGTALFSPAVLLFALGVALVSSAIPISLEMVALKRLPQAVFGILISLEPAVAALLGLLLLHEQLSVLQWAAIGCIMAAAVGSSLTAAHHH